MRTTTRVLFSLFLLSFSVAIVQAQSRCEQQRENGNEGQFLQCQSQEREQRARRRVEDHENQIELQQDRIELFFDREKQKLDLAWREADFELEHEIEDMQFRLRSLQQRDSQGTETVELRLEIEEKRRERSFLRTSFQAYLRWLDDRMQLEVSTQNFELKEYELSSRGLPGLFDSLRRYYRR